MAILVICIGNLARGDDGVARHVADALKRPGLPANVDLVSAPQLDVVMAEGMANAGRVIVVDAERRSEPAIKIERIDLTGENAAPATPQGAFPRGSMPGHALDPRSLVLLARTLYGSVPAVFLVTVAAPEMGHGEALSATAAAARDEATRSVLALLHEDA